MISRTVKQKTIKWPWLTYTGLYRIILADPPWRFKNWSMSERAKRGEKWAHRNGRSPYDAMNTNDICNMPVEALIDPKSAALFLWATHPKLPDALKVMEAWGFHHTSTAWTWVKIGKNSGGLLTGMGYGTRKNTEILLLGTRGKTPERLDNCMGEVVFWPRMEHSRKPDCFHDLIIQLYGDLPRAELFARRPREGWHVWGNQAESSPNITPALGTPEPFKEVNYLPEDV